MMKVAESSYFLEQHEEMKIKMLILFIIRFMYPLIF